MTFAGKIWRLLVAIKDALALLFFLIFFGVLYAMLASRPGPAAVQEGALLITLNGVVVEEQSTIRPLDLLISGTIPPGEYNVHDVVRAIDAAATDKRIKAIALDLSSFIGGGRVHLADIGAALDRFRASKKKVLAYAGAYMDEGLQLAAHADEIWVDPLGGAIIRGPGGHNLYYAGLLDKLDIKPRIFRVGTHKSAVEPYTRSNMSDEARADAQGLVDAIWAEWRAEVAKARPQAKLDLVTRDPAGWLTAHKGNFARASKEAGLIDRIGTRIAFGTHLAGLVGKAPHDKSPGAFAHTSLETWMASLPRKKPGKAIGVITIAGEIVDGEAGPGVAGGKRIADLLDKALKRDLAALVVRVDSPGGSVTASEDIRRAILRHKARKIPIAVSMANVAASGGYWVATPADRIFAEPSTVTGSIGIFAIVPSFENLLARWGVTGDGVRTTPLSGQPDMRTGLTPEVETMLQQLIEHGYGRFLNLVADARGKSVEEIDQIAQGRVWAGGAARQVGLVDEYGGLQDALEWAAGKAGLKDGEWHASFLSPAPKPFEAMLKRAIRGEEADATGTGTPDAIALLAGQQQAIILQAITGLRHMLGTQGAQAFCLACPALPQIRPAPGPTAANLATGLTSHKLMGNR